MTDELEGAIDRAIAECDGDARAAIRALIIANAFLAREVERLDTAISRGFTRGRMRREGQSTGPGGDPDPEELTNADAKPFATRQ